VFQLAVQEVAIGRETLADHQYGHGSHSWPARLRFASQKSNAGGVRRRASRGTTYPSWAGPVGSTVAR
jgi:hypothetical protein